MLRVNVGCGGFPLQGYENLDADPSTPADRHVTVPPMPYEDDTVDEIYLGHLLEHLAPKDAHALLIECRRVLKVGGKLGVVVPDTRAIMTRYLSGPPTEVEYGGYTFRLDDLDHVCAMFLYSVVQPSHHLWSYDQHTLGRAIAAAGFELDVAINRFTDPRISKHEWYGCGWDAHKPEAVTR